MLNDYANLSITGFFKLSPTLLFLISGFTAHYAQFFDILSKLHIER